MIDFCASVSYINFSCDMQLSDLTDRRIISNVSVFNWTTDEITGSHFLRNYKNNAVVVVRPDGSAMVDMKQLPFSDFSRLGYFLLRVGIHFNHR